MKTLFGACMRRLCFSNQEAADWLDCSIDTVKNWSAGRNPVPNGVWDELRNYEAQIIHQSEAIREAWEDAGEPNVIDAHWDDDLGLKALADFVLTQPLDKVD